METGRKERLLERLDGIASSLERCEEALALLGLGSIGVELARLDEYSDLDFFVIAAPGCKERFIERVDWLDAAHPLAYHFKNSDLGRKIMFEDGIYGEFAIFEEADLLEGSYSEGRFVWMRDTFRNVELAKPAAAYPSIRRDSADFPLNEALTNLYVGLCRYARGEKLSAVRFVQGYAVDSILSVLHLLEPEVEYFPDKFGNERRLEKRFPDFATRVGDMIQGYGKLPESALRILDFLEESYPVNAKLSDEIRRLAACLR
ncbi:hypothetical protein ACFPPD_21845 [Cohnella suwonensis]|uniref:DUF4037 domain-containing protein n=1 Tax=Cohnella suwonensis TaxID=696072 RepID=A0ABW0LZT7_9BACL